MNYEVLKEEIEDFNAKMAEIMLTMAGGKREQ